MGYFHNKRKRLKDKNSLTSGKLRHDDQTESTKLHGMPDFDPKTGLPVENDKERKKIKKDENPILDPKVSPQHFSSAEDGLEAHLHNLETSLARHETRLLAAQEKSKYTNMPAKERDHIIKMAQRTHKYLMSGIRLTKVAIEARNSGNPNWNSLVGTGNAKVGKMGILTFGNTLPGHNCPARGSCGDGSCYGLVGQQAMGGPLELRARNSGLIHRPDFVEGATEALKNAPKRATYTIDEEGYNHIKDHPRFKEVLLNEPKRVVVNGKEKIRFGVKLGDYVRWHDSGDIVNTQHLDNIAKVAKAFPDKKFYLYTKSLHLPLDRLSSLSNMNVIQSFGGKHNDKIDLSKPHASYFSTAEEAVNAGYESLDFHDWDAARGAIKLGLTPHGTRRKEVDVEAQSEGVPGEDVQKSGDFHSRRGEPDWFQFDQPDALAQRRATGSKGKLRSLSMLYHNDDYNLDKILNLYSNDAGTLDSRINKENGTVANKSEMDITSPPKKKFGGRRNPRGLTRYFKKLLTQKCEKVAKGDVISLKDAKVRSESGELPKTSKPAKSPFSVKQRDRSRMSTQQKIQTSLNQQGDKGSPYAGTRPSPNDRLTPSKLPTLSESHGQKLDRVRTSMHKINQLMEELGDAKKKELESSLEPIKKALMRSKQSEQSQDPADAMSQTHPGVIPENHPDREKMASFINKLNQTPGKRGRAFQLYSRFISGKGYVKSEALSDMIKAEVMEDHRPRFIADPKNKKKLKPEDSTRIATLQEKVDKIKD